MLNIYKASAGSGKTYNLAYWYIKLLLGQIDPETGQYSLARGRLHSHATILAVTFTNKATQEMKERIISQLSILAAAPQKSKYLNWLKRDLHTSDVDAISQTAKEALASLLFNFSLFHISTIDSFFQQILRSFAIEIDRPANFTVEMDEMLILNMAVDEMFDHIDDDADVKEWIRLFMKFKFEQNEAVNIFDKESGLHSDLVSTIASFMTEEYRLNRETIDGYLSQPHRINDFYKQLTKTVSTVKEKLKRDADAFLKNAEGLMLKKNFLTFIASLQKNVTYKNVTAAALKVAEGDPEGAFLKAEVTKGIPEELKKQLKDLVKYFCDTFEKVKLADLLRKQVFFFGLLGKVTALSERICRENNIILLSNTNELINRIIGENPAISPFIYERVGCRLHNYLMDEFQDTSELQWLNMKPLLRESLSYKNDNLIIGDEKQCIYRFRNSSPELLSHQVRSQIEKESPVKEQGNLIEENTNWRSAPEIILFNNTLFYALGNEIDPTSAYAHVMQGIAADNSSDEGHVKLRFFGDQKGEKDAEKEKLKSSEIEVQVLDAMIAEIRRLLEHYKPGDIAILVDKNKYGEKVIARLLEAMEPKDGAPAELPRFEIVSNDAMRVSSATSVKMLINQLRLSENPETEPVKDEERQAGKQWVRRTVTDFTALEQKFEQYYSDYRNDKDSPAARALHDALFDKEVPLNLLDAATRGHQCNDLVSVVERLIGELPPKMREEETIFITAFQDLVINYSERGGSDILGFLSWWDKTGVKAMINSPENKKALTVSTIHKSKGLEYPCVLIPFANWLFQEDSSTKKRFFNWYDIKSVLGDSYPDAPAMLPLKKEKQLGNTLLNDQYEKYNRQQRIDALNLTYVAFTRAQRELVIFVQDSTKNKEFSLAEYLRKALNTSRANLIERIDAMTGEMDSAETKLLHDSVLDLEGFYNSEEKLFELGETNRRDLEIKRQREEEREKKEKEIKDERTEYTVQSQPMPSYEARDNEKTLKFMRLATDDDFDPDNARDKGVFMHYVLSKVVTPSSLYYACLQRGTKIRLRPEVIEERFMELKRAIESPMVARWFTGFKRVITERGIYVKDKSETYRPDRVVWTDDGHIDVVDYKFGDRHGYERYVGQVKNYVRLLRESGYRNVRGYLWYPLDSFVYTVVDDDSNESLI